jgi:hypothetical protein
MIDASPVNIVYPISTTLTPQIDIGTIVYYQNGVYGTPKGLLLALTVTPDYKKTIMTSNGLRIII